MNDAPRLEAFPRIQCGFLFNQKVYLLIKDTYKFLILLASSASFPRWSIFGLVVPRTLEGRVDIFLNDAISFPLNREPEAVFDVGYCS